MKISTTQAALGAALALLSAPASAALAHRHHHDHMALHKKHAQHHHVDNREAKPNDTQLSQSEMVKRGMTCAFPTNKGAVAITPNSLNGGWAMAPDKACTHGKWCPIACPPGQVMAQWKPDTTYKYPESTYGGVYCNDNGELEEGFKGKPWCVDGTGAVEAVNEAGSVVSFCQTILPGDEDMLAATEVHSSATLAVPGISYWDKTSAHFYVNPPGVGAAEGCVWGTITKPVGNWAAYVAGANTDSNGNTFVKLGFNPEWTGASALAAVKPNYAMEIKCADGGCNGLPCAINPDGINGQGGATNSAFCVVTVPSGSKAQIVVTSLDGSGGPAPQPEETSSAYPTAAPTPTPTPTTSSEAQTSTSSTSSAAVYSLAAVGTSSFSSPSSSSIPTSSSSSSSSSSLDFAGVFQENGTYHSSTQQQSTSAPMNGPTNIESGPAPTQSNDGATTGYQGNGAIAGLIVALVAAGILL